MRSKHWSHGTMVHCSALRPGLARLVSRLQHFLGPWTIRDLARRFPGLQKVCQTHALIGIENRCVKPPARTAHALAILQGEPGLYVIGLLVSLAVAFVTL